MFAAALKVFAIYLLNQRFSQAKIDLREVKENVADFAESRALFLKHNLLQDLQRMVNGFIGYLAMFTAFIFTGIIGLMWIFAVAWDSAHREIILGVVMVIPLLVGIVIFAALRKIWKENPFMSKSTQLISRDWNSFRHNLDGTADISEEANN